MPSGDPYLVPNYTYGETLTSTTDQTAPQTTNAIDWSAGGTWWQSNTVRMIPPARIVEPRVMVEPGPSYEDEWRGDYVFPSSPVSPRGLTVEELHRRMREIAAALDAQTEAAIDAQTEAAIAAITRRRGSPDARETPIAPLAARGRVYELED